MKTFDLTKEQPKLPSRRADDICSDHDADCYTPDADGKPHDAMRCWLYAPECGICPLLTRKEPSQCQ